ncbi:hypothetical protein [Botryobacter ruber]|uniref:hypothetical protein n=1 Tax=Botryobacter ruber TaxID=2171629 RepID=UPI000F653F4C|nr:hypothetical protein [Botryobacter ruber]
MKSSKSLNEAIFRAHPSTEENTQSQEQLYHMTQPDQPQNRPAAKQQKAPLNECHKNLMQSWMNLRAMDSALAEKFGNDMMG